MRIIRFDEMPSTNQYVHELIQRNQCFEGLCVKTEFQTRGKGQPGNSWESERGMNLTFSLVLSPRFIAPAEQFILSQMVALSIQNVLSRLTPHVTVKWPNDIYWNDRKLGGILIENTLMGAEIEFCIIGIGLNVNQKTFLSDAPNPVSLANILDVETDADRLLDELLGELMTNYHKLSEPGGAEAIRTAYGQVLYRRTGYHCYADEQGSFSARLESISQDGRLNLLTESGEKRAYYFKEVTFIH